jgi:hypothetical protein
MTFVVHMLAHTPPYVFVLLAYLIWQGLRSLRTRQQSVWRMLIVPGLFIASGLLLLVLRPSGTILPMVASLVGLVAFVPLGLATGPRILEVDRASGWVTRAGSPVSLVRNLLVFAAQYSIAVALFRHAEAQASPRRGWARSLGHVRGLFHRLDDCVPTSLPGSTRCGTFCLGSDSRCHGAKFLDTVEKLAGRAGCGIVLRDVTTYYNNQSP